MAMFRRTVFALFLLASCLARASANTATDDFPGWFPSWVQSYRRFEAYIADRKENWPTANLQIMPNGAMFHEVPHVSGRAGHLSLEIYERGVNLLTLGMTDQLLAEGREKLLAPGQYAACMKSVSSLGYQHHFPIVWLETKNPDHPTDRISTELQITSPPGAGEQIWPNERLLLFLDYHIFPHRHPDDLRVANRRAEPSIRLKVDNQGVVSRLKLADTSGEKLLRWRIYYEGRLVESGPASGVERLETDHGVGSYQVFIGIEGPSGFMPVSNWLEYPLFPDASGRHVIIPSKIIRGVPDFIRQIVNVSDASDPVSGGQDMDHDGLFNSEEAGQPPIVIPPKPPDEVQLRLLKLWEAWSYQVINDRILPKPDDL